MSKASYQEIAEAVWNLIQESDDGRRLAQQLAAYLIEHRRTGELDKVMREVERMQVERSGLVEVTATSAHELSQAIKQEISQIFSGKSVKVIEKHDESLVGSVHLRTLDEQLDLSVRGQLNALKGSLKG